MATDTVTLPTLTRDEFETLLLALGYATGAALARKERSLSLNFIRLMNALNRDNPDYVPYEIPSDRGGEKE
jgi:hypothetical protein